MEPVFTKGNAFWRGEMRFLIKGISYFPHSQDHEGNATIIDALADNRLHDLERDIKVLQELGLNTIRVRRLDLGVDHNKAMQLLAKAGIYVLVDVGERIKRPSGNDPNFNAASSYTLAIVRRALRIADQLCDHPNLLGITVECPITARNTSRLAQVSRAAVRDLKAFLRMRGGRQPPVGVHVPDNMITLLPSLQYFTAGVTSDRVDYFSHSCYSWAGQSSFRVSGWQNMCQAFAPYPVPMFLAEYGTVVSKREWTEVECLYSPEMTGVFSGGCAYTFYESNNGHGIVIVDETTTTGLVRKDNFWELKKQFEAVNKRTEEELYGENQVRSYEEFTGTFPTVQGNWFATPNVVPLPASATVLALLGEIRDEKVAEGIDQLRIGT